MNGEYLLDAVGLLDDDLIREAEEYSRPRRDYRPWIGLAASFAVVLTLGYALTHLGMGGGSAAPGDQVSGGAAPDGSYGGVEAPPLEGAPPTNPAEGPEDSASQGAESLPAGSGVSAGPETLAVLVNGGLYRSTGEIIQLSPDEGEVQYGLSWYDEESGKSRSEEDRRWLMLEDGRVAVFWDVEERGWLTFTPTVEP